MNPLLKWAGGKRWALSYLTPLYERHKRLGLCEMFAGGAALAFATQAERVWLNDTNKHLINFYRRVQSGDVFPPLDSMGDLNTEEQYYTSRDRFNELIAHDEHASSFERAALFYYLNKTCFNGLCRFNRNGRFNVPYGRRKRVDFSGDTIAFITARHLMQQWTLTSEDFSNICLDFDPAWFVFADPPYDGTFSDYSTDGFNWVNQLQLAGKLAKYDGPVVVMNAATPRILELYRDWRFDVQTIDARRSIAANGDRVSAREMIATKNI